MYIDPNTGGVLFQVLAVVIGLFSGAVLLFSSRIKASIARMRRVSRYDHYEGDDQIYTTKDDEVASQINENNEDLDH